jgi:hypothetical protein
MKNLILFTLLLIFFLPTSLKAQWKRETGFLIGIISPSYKQLSTDENPGQFFKLGVSESWTNKDKRVSFRPEIGINSEILSYNYGIGGLAAGVNYKGSIASFNGSLSTFIQYRTNKTVSIAIGPSGRYVFINKYHITRTPYYNSYEMGYDYHPVKEEQQGFDRKFINQPSIGIKTLILANQKGGKTSMGFVFDYQWKKAMEDYFFFHRTVEISFYLGLH